MGTTACCRFKWPFGALFKNKFELAGEVATWQPAADYLAWQFCAFQIQIKACAPKGNCNMQLAATPDQIT
jgi:hypothetical protein